MNNLLSKTCVLVLVALLIACGRETPVAQPETSAVEVIADELFAALMDRNPTLGTYYSIQGARHDRLPDNSLAAMERWQQREDAWLAALEAVRKPEPTGSRDWITYGILRESLEGSIATRVCRSELWRASTATAWPIRCC